LRKTWLEYRMAHMKSKVLVILGSTTTGKSELAVKIAKKWNGEIISADSRQVYKGLNIGTGKITKKEMRGVPHYLLDVVLPQKTFTVAEFQKLGQEKIEDILKRGKLPIICGGTGFYLDALINGTTFPEVKADKKLRTNLQKKNLKELFLILERLDTRRAKEIDKNNKVRLIRAIEIAKTLGEVPIPKTDSKYNVLKIGLKLEDAQLKAKIHDRLISRLKKGMIKEGENLRKNGLSLKRMRELGLEYRGIADFLDKKLNKKEFIKKLDTDIWQFSKRQKTWFKRDKKIHWFNPKESKEINSLVKNFLD
jgi:tRNA dimethylallyltransferase